MNGRRSLVRIFALPLLVFCVCLAGLVVALLANEQVDPWASLAAGACLPFVLLGFRRRR